MIYMDSLVGRINEQYFRKAESFLICEGMGDPYISGSPYLYLRSLTPKS